MINYGGSLNKQVHAGEGRGGPGRDVTAPARLLAGRTAGEGVERGAAWA